MLKPDLLRSDEQAALRKQGNRCKSVLSPNLNHAENPTDNWVLTQGTRARQEQRLKGKTGEAPGISWYRELQTMTVMKTARSTKEDIHVGWSAQSTKGSKKQTKNPMFNHLQRHGGDKTQCSFTLSTLALTEVVFCYQTALTVMLTWEHHFTPSCFLDLHNSLCFLADSLFLLTEAAGWLVEPALKFGLTPPFWCIIHMGRCSGDTALIIKFCKWQGH